MKTSATLPPAAPTSALAIDSARQADEHQTAAIALGHTAQLAHAEGMTTAALDHLK